MGRHIIAQVGVASECETRRPGRINNASGVLQGRHKSDQVNSNALLSPSEKRRQAKFELQKFLKKKIKLKARSE